MTDGANMGIGAERALKTILGGAEQPADDERQNREQVRARLRDVPRLHDIQQRVDVQNGERVTVLYWRGKPLDFDYSGTTDIAARAVLDYLATHSEHIDAPYDNEYEPDAFANYDPNNSPTPTRKGLYDLMKADGYDLGILDLTGFMWGFAYNTARWLLYEDARSNPALITIEATDDGVV